jgi:hypothetical protein
MIETFVWHTLDAQFSPSMKQSPSFRIFLSVFEAFTNCVVASAQSRASTRFHGIIGLGGNVIPPDYNRVGAIVGSSESTSSCFRPFVYRCGKRVGAP